MHFLNYNKAMKDLDPLLLLHGATSSRVIRFRAINFLSLNLTVLLLACGSGGPNLHDMLLRGKVVT